MRLYAYMNSFIFFSLMVYHREYLFRNNVIDVFIYGCADLHYCTGFSLVASSRGYSLAAAHTGSRAHSGSVVVRCPLAVLLHTESPWTRDQTHVLCKMDS